MTTVKSSLPAAARFALGAIFFVFGLNGFFHFLPQPPAPPAAQAFFGALFASGYFVPLLKTTEVAAGALLLSNRYVPLALTVLAPIVVNIVAFHTFLAPGGLGIALFVLATEIALAWYYRESFRGVLTARATPRGAKSIAVEGIQPPAPSRA